MIASYRGESPTSLARLISSRKLTLILVALALVSGIALVLARRVTALSRAYADLQKRASLPYRGYVVPTVRAETLAGDSVTIGELADSSSVQLVFVFTTTCPYCKATLPVWDVIADSVERLHGNKARVIGISLDSTRLTSEYIRANQLDYPVGFFPDWKAIRLFRARMVPQTLVLSRIGQVLYSHVGRLERGPGLDSLFLAVAEALTPRAAVAVADAPQSTP